MREVKKPEKATRRQRRGIISTGISLISYLILIVLMAWVGLLMVFSGYRVCQGAQATYQRIATMQMMNDQLLKRTPIYGANHADEILQLNEKQLLTWITQNSLIPHSMAYMKQQQAAFSAHFHLPAKQHKNPFARLGQKMKIFFSEGIAIAWGVTRIMLGRVLIFLLAIPLFLLCAMLGVVDGLVQRDIRKFQGARESTLFFHQMKSNLSFWFFIPMFAYFAWPWATMPTWFLIPIAFVMSVFIQASLRSFKKYV